MDKSASSSSSTEMPVVIPPKEKILFETQPLLNSKNIFRLGQAIVHRLIPN